MVGKKSTSNTPVARISSDGGETFGAMMGLGTNGTLGSGEAEEIGVAAGEEGGGGETTVEEPTTPPDGGG